MGDHSLHFDAFDSLDYLIPPVKKPAGNLETDILFSRDFKRQTDIRLIKDFRKKITRRIRSPSILRESDVQTSSVILRKTSEEEHYSVPVVNSNNKNSKTNKLVNEERRKKCINGDKPMIKVTVIPKVAEIQTSKIFNKRREKTKKLQTTVSNQESSIKSQNIFFMVRGKKREKVHEIKSTESTNLSNKIFNARYEDISIQQITNSKRLINSLNMEKKKRKNKKIENNHKNNNFFGTCQNSKNYEKSEGVNARKSKVTIVGQLGLNRDDQYILKCAATVNDKPIATDYVHLDNTTYRNLLNINRNEKGFTPNYKTTGFSLDDSDDYRTRSYQDSNVQTDTCQANNCTYLNSKHKERRNISQATQVNFNPPQHKPPKGFQDKVVQCNCDNSTTEKNAFNFGTQENVLKDSKSPLVIISVYPKHNQDDNNCPVKIIHQPTASPKVANNSDFTKSKGRMGQQRNNNPVTVNLFEQRSLRSRSPSPVTKTLPNKTLKNKTVHQGLRKHENMNNLSPQRVQTNLSKNSENKSKHKVNKLNKDVSCYCPYSIGLGNQEFVQLGLNDAKETDTKQVKRALVNNFLKNVDRIDQNSPKMNLFAPKVDTSRVTVNIYGEDEFYDVSFEQSNFETGLSVRKTQKKQVQTQNTVDEIDITSTEKFLMLSEKNKNTPMTSQEKRETFKAVPKESRLNVRDSLEIRRSREGRGGRGGKNNLTASLFNSDAIGNNPKPLKLWVLRARNLQLGERIIPSEPPRAVEYKIVFCGDHCKGPLSGREGLSVEVTRTMKSLAPIKHYRGDNCSIPDPNERDREIRELLGIARNTRNNKKDEHVTTKEVFYSHPENNRRVTCRCCKKCNSKGIMTEISISKLAKKCRRKYKSKNQGKSTVPKTQLKKFEAKKKETKKKVSETSSYTQSEEFSYHKNQGRIPEKQGNDNGTNEDVTAEIPQKESFIQHNLILNRNVQVFLQIEQFNKQKPIILTQKQYDQLKKTIQCTINQRKYCKFNNFNVVSLHEIKIKPKLQQKNHYDREVQTKLSEMQKTLRCIQIQTQHSNYKTQTAEKHTHMQQVESSQKLIDNIMISTTNKVNDKIISIAANNNDKTINKDNKHVKPNEITARQTVSSMEIHYANVAFMKNITISSAHFRDGLHNQNNTPKINTPKVSTSLHTIFKGHRKSRTPNLGTSAYSLCSDANDSTKSIKASPYAGDFKPKKPFLQRLLSCLVMRSTETTVLKEVLERKLPSVNSSVDSYHISSSLGALEMTSTLYDTSASFYSNHTIAPTNKMKRGFLSSVRGFLTTRRS